MCWKILTQNILKFRIPAEKCIFVFKSFQYVFINKENIVGGYAPMVAPPLWINRRYGYIHYIYISCQKQDTWKAINHDNLWYNLSDWLVVHSLCTVNLNVNIMVAALLYDSYKCDKNDEIKTSINCTLCKLPIRPNWDIKWPIKYLYNAPNMVGL